MPGTCGYGGQPSTAATMPLTLTCPHCRAALRLAEPFPVPGDTVRCASCTRIVTATFPRGLEATLVTAGRRFAPIGGPYGSITVRKPGARPPGGSDTDEAPPTAAEVGYDDAPLRADPPRAQLDGRGASVGDFGPPRKRRIPDPPAPLDAPSWSPGSDASSDDVLRPVSPAPRDLSGPATVVSTRPPPTAPVDVRGVTPPAGATSPPRMLGGPPPPAADATTPRGGRWLRRGLVGLAVAAVLLVVGYFGVSSWYAADLPSVERLQAYRPATVTTVYAADGSVMGELYEQRRYVLPLDQIPELVRNAFIAAEDANFYGHGGIDYGGIARAAGRNLLQFRVAQGGSTITQQVAKNFLLSSDRRLERKIKEALLAWRIEEAYDKDHILYLYLNEIFLGAQAYGVEAAARTFFAKSVDELTLAEAAVLAGLPPRPSAWNPQADLAQAKVRQKYVLDRMLAVGFIDQRQHTEALAQALVIAGRTNAFREGSPHFTEHVRRLLVEKYGEDRVLREGLTVTTTCDPALQAAAQQAVVDGVTRVDERVGFRRDAIENLADEAARTARADAIDAELLHSLPVGSTGTGRDALVPGKVSDAVVTKVSATWAEVAVGHVVGVIPMAWSKWVYPPDVARDWRGRTQDDFTRPVDADGDGVKEGGILRVGDVVRVRVVAGSTQDAEVAEAFADTPGATTPHLAVRLVQPSELQGALFSFDVRGDDAGAVRAMVGGVDFDRSELNRAVQSRRQVGSTFKAIVYAAAIEGKRLTTASIVPDAPLAFVTEEGTWKPENYGGDYRGNITLRQALTLSRNTSTVRVLDAVDPNMGRDLVYSFARKLGLGGPPTHALPDGWAPSPDTAWLCPWLASRDGRHCTDAAQAEDGKTYCRACDLSIGLGSAALTMEEMTRAFAVFASGGVWVEPYTLVKVVDRDGNVLEEHQPAPPVRVISPELAVVTTWLLENVATRGTGAAAHRDLRVHVAGKTGTTNDARDAWFVGYTPDVATAVWVGYDQPKSIGPSATGGTIALPIWVDYMKHVATKDVPFPEWATVEWANIEESTGRRVSSGGSSYPFLPGTAPQATALQAGQASLEDLSTE